MSLANEFYILGIFIPEIFVVFVVAILVIAGFAVICQVGSSSFHKPLLVSVDHPTYHRFE